MWNSLRSANAKNDMINVPGSTDGCWIWRCHKRMEDLINEDKYNDFLKKTLRVREPLRFVSLLSRRRCRAWHLEPFSLCWTLFSVSEGPRVQGVSVYCGCFCSVAEAGMVDNGGRQDAKRGVTY